MGLFDGILSGLGWIWDQTGGRAAGAVWDQIVQGLVGWVVDAVGWFVHALLAFFERTSTPNLASGWFAGGPLGAGAHSPYAVVVGVALSLLLLCVLLSVVHGLVLGEATMLLGRLARDVPLAVLGMVATIGVAQVLLSAADEVSTRILSGTEAGTHATQVLRTLGESQAFKGQSTFVVFLLGLVAVIGAFLLWVELLVRASLVYVLIALSPLAYAAFVWPATRRILRRLTELIVALILSKVVIAITLAVAASALVSNPGGVAGVPNGEARLGTLLVGTIMFLLAVFAPFLILRLVPVVEAAVVARGISRAPVRSAQTAMLTALTVNRLAGLAGGGSSGPPAPPVSTASTAATTVAGAPSRPVTTRVGVPEPPPARRVDASTSRRLPRTGTSSADDATPGGEPGRR